MIDDDRCDHEVDVSRRWAGGVDTPVTRVGDAAAAAACLEPLAVDRTYRLVTRPIHSINEPNSSLYTY